MTSLRFGLIVLAGVVFSTAGARPARASSYQLCLALDGETGQYFMNFAMQGNAVLVAGHRGHGGQEDHGPLFGALSHAPDTPQYMELGLTVTFSNGGDYFNQNTENVVFKFFPSGAITYKRWLHSTKTFTEGTVTVLSCPP